VLGRRQQPLGPLENVIISSILRIAAIFICSPYFTGNIGTLPQPFERRQSTTPVLCTSQQPHYRSFGYTFHFQTFSNRRPGEASDLPIPRPLGPSAWSFWKRWDAGEADSRFGASWARIINLFPCCYSSLHSHHHHRLHPPLYRTASLHHTRCNNYSWGKGRRGFCNGASQPPADVTIPAFDQPR
jgi:hypothetical protein